MANLSFNGELDRLASHLDPRGHEDRRWAGAEGKRLNFVTETIEQLFGDRQDFELEPIGAAPKEVRAYMLKVKATGENAARLTVRVDGAAINVWPVAVEGGVVRLPPNPSPAAIVDAINSDKVREAVAQALSQMRA